MKERDIRSTLKKIEGGERLAVRAAGSDDFAIIGAVEVAPAMKGWKGKLAEKIACHYRDSGNGIAINIDSMAIYDPIAERYLCRFCVVCRVEEFLPKLAALLIEADKWFEDGVEELGSHWAEKGFGMGRPD